MFSPKPFSKGNPCPVCNSDSASCRYNRDDEDFILCHTHVDASLGEVVGGFVCVKESNGHTASFKPYTGNLSEQAKRSLETRRLQEKQLRDNKRKAEQNKRRHRALSASDRHNLYSEILGGLKVDPATTADLKGRGFTDEEIARSGFKSVREWQWLNNKYDTQLPGISKNGWSLAVGSGGYLCPVQDFSGRIVAAQLRLHNPVDGNRYKWLSTPSTATLKVQPEDELPLAVFHPPSGKPSGIAIVEGVGAKPFWVSQKLNYLVIGAAGGQWLSSPKLLEKYIKQAIAVYGELPINVIPDAGFALNKAVAKNLLNLFGWLQENFVNLEIKVLEWNQIHKSQGDIDELKDLSIVRCLKLESFLKKYRAVFDTEKGSVNKQFQDWAKRRVKLTADIIQHEKWLSIPQRIEKECDILIVRKALGGGKTNALIEYLKRLGKVALAVSYRNSLMGNTVYRANSAGLSAIHIKDTLDIIQGQRIDFRLDDSTKLYCGCADSFQKFDKVIEHNPEYILIHDEVCSIFNHLKGGGTLKDRQQQAIEWDVNAIRNSSFAIMMDAFVSDRDVEFLRALFPSKRIKVLDSIHPTKPRKFIFLETESSTKEYTQGAKYLPSQLVEKAKAVGKVLWISDSQRSCELADEMLTGIGHKHYRLDGKTSHEELAKQFQSNPKDFIVTQLLDSTSLSPSAESGLSIDLYDYFDVVCLDIRGTVGVNTLLQMSGRLRDTDVPIYVACPEFVNITKDPCPYPMAQVEEVLLTRINWLLESAKEADERLINSDFVANMFDEMATKFSSDPWFLASLEDAKQLKYEHQNLKMCLKTALAQAGNIVIDHVEKADEGQHSQVKETKEIIKEREAKKIFDSPDIEWEKAQELMKKDVNYDQKCQIAKARLKHLLPGIEDTPSWSPQLVKALLIDDPQFINKRWRLMQLQQEELAASVFKNSHSWCFEHGFTADQVWKASTTKIDALKVLGVGQIIEASEFSSQDDWVLTIVEEYYSQQEYFNLIGIPKAKKSHKKLSHIKTMVDRFLDYFGLVSRHSRKTKDRRWYTAQAPEAINGFLSDIDQCLKRRGEKSIDDATYLSAPMAIARMQQQREWEQQHRADLNNRIHQVALNRNDSDLVASIRSYSIELNENDATKSSDKKPCGQTQEWDKPESIGDVTNYIESERVASIRSYSIKLNENDATKSSDKKPCGQTQEWDKPESIAQNIAPTEIVVQPCLGVSAPGSTPEPQQETAGKPCWVWHCSQWKQATLKTLQDKPPSKFFKAVVELVSGLSMIVWQRECFEMAA
ncbi:hypothetical protein [Fischerella sp. PCC 9605]|uniref:hypothetical protein n=1 Tax=Fischerella sp. PCC 9605 TaxID=1173024 RepID=UPI00047DED11|nr:hypothetical protein [Fischerella sp. PCC 9605]